MFIVNVFDQLLELTQHKSRLIVILTKQSNEHKSIQNPNENLYFEQLITCDEHNKNKNHSNRIFQIALISIENTLRSNLKCWWN